MSGVFSVSTKWHVITSERHTSACSDFWFLCSFLVELHKGDCDHKDFAARDTTSLSLPRVWQVIFEGMWNDN